MKCGRIKHIYERYTRQSLNKKGYMYIHVKNATTYAGNKIYTIDN